MIGKRIVMFLAGIALTIAGLVIRNRVPAGNSPDDSESGSQAAQLSGTIQMAGSSSMEKLANALAESFMDRYPGVTVTVQFTGSSAGIAAVSEGNADIGNSSRYLKDEERAGGVVENIVALDGIIACVDPSNTITGLTYRQLTDIFTGKITNWSALTGEDLPIVVVGREAGSGTRSAFEKRLGIEERCTYSNEVDSTGAVMARVASTPGAIGYVSLDTMNSSTSSMGKGTVVALSLDGIEPTLENIRSGRYPLYRPFIMATRGEISAQSQLMQAWFAYVYSEEGRRIAEKSGLAIAD